MSSLTNQVARFTGADAYITFTVNGVIYEVSSEYQKFNYEGSIRLEEKTAGNERDASFNATIREGKWDLTVFDLGKVGIVAGLNQLFFEGQIIDILSVYKKGRVNGEPYMSFPAIVSGVKHPFEYDKNIMIEISGVKNGAYIAKPFSLVSGV